jgi:hypothetical protein
VHYSHQIGAGYPSVVSSILLELSISAEIIRWEQADFAAFRGRIPYKKYSITLTL